MHFYHNTSSWDIFYSIKTASQLTLLLCCNDHGRYRELEEMNSLYISMKTETENLSKDVRNCKIALNLCQSNKIKMNIRAKVLCFALQSAAAQKLLIDTWGLN